MKEALQIISNSNEKLSMLEGRVLKLLAESYLRLGDAKKAQIYTDKGVKILENLNLKEDLLTEDSANPYLADIYIVKADILRQCNEYNDSKKYYQYAEEIYLRRFNNNIQSTRLSSLYQKLFTINIELDNISLANHYYDMHKDYFGSSDEKNKGMLEKLLSVKAKSR